MRGREWGGGGRRPGRCSLATGWLVVWPYNENAVIEIEPLRQSILTAYKKKDEGGVGGGVEEVEEGVN